MSENIEETGDCFEAAIWLADRLRNYEGISIDEDSPYRLVHGFPLGQGTIAGIKHSHAWVERTDPRPEGIPEVFGPEHFIACLDKSNGKDIEWSRPAYYGIGNIDPAECRYYTIREAFRLVVEYHHFGPWDDEHPPFEGWADEDEDEEY